jgi:hypothetical protein
LSSRGNLITITIHSISPVATGLESSWCLCSIYGLSYSLLGSVSNANRHLCLVIGSRHSHLTRRCFHQCAALPSLSPDKFWPIFYWMVSIKKSLA